MANNYKELALQYINEDDLPRCLQCGDVISDSGGEGGGLCYDCFAKQQNDTNSDENNYHNNEDNDQSSRSGLTFTHSRPGEINEYGDTGTGMGQYSAGMSSNSVGTFASPNVSQNPGSFASNHPSMYYPVGANKVDMYNNYRVTGPSDDDIKKLKKTVTPDEILCGMNAILKSMFCKNKSKAREILVQNLKRDPQYYSSLRYLGIDGTDEQLAESICDDGIKQFIRDSEPKTVIKENMLNTNEDLKVSVTEVQKIIDEMVKNRNPAWKDCDPDVAAAYNDSIERRKNDNIKRIN